MDVKVMQHIVEAMRGMPQHQEQNTHDEDIEKRIVKQWWYAVVERRWIAHDTKR